MCKNETEEYFMSSIRLSAVCCVCVPIVGCVKMKRCWKSFAEISTFFCDLLSCFLREIDPFQTPFPNFKIPLHHQLHAKNKKRSCNLFTVFCIKYLLKDEWNELNKKRGIALFDFRLHLDRTFHVFMAISSSLRRLHLLLLLHHNLHHLMVL